MTSSIDATVVENLTTLVRSGQVFLIVAGPLIAFAVAIGVAFLIASLCSAAAQRYRRRRIGDAADPAERASRVTFVRRMLSSGAIARDADAVAFRLSSDGHFTDTRVARAYADYRAAKAKRQDDTTFLVSLFATYWTRSPILGFALGGNLTGALLGWLLLPANPSSDTSTSQSTARYDERSPSSECAAPDDQGNSWEPPTDCASASDGSYDGGSTSTYSE